MADANSKPGKAVRKSKALQMMVRTLYAPSLYDEVLLQPLGPIPWINLYGGWLAQFGFERGLHVTVEASWQRLVITIPREQSWEARHFRQLDERKQQAD